MLITMVLTKKMAEQLTRVPERQRRKVRYLHSDVDTVERVEIIRDLRLARSMCWWASTCCARAWTPEVSLVAILDADKEGFAFRAQPDPNHWPGGANPEQAIICTPTGSPTPWRGAMARPSAGAKQIAFNAANGITPKALSRRCGPD